MNFRHSFSRECCTHSLLALVFCALLSPGSRGAPTTSDSSSAPSSSAYTNQTSTPSVVYDSGTSSSSISSFSSSSSPTFSDTYRPIYTPFYFPPTTPVLGEKIPYRAAPFYTSRATSVSAQMAPYVGELFYPPLASRFGIEDLSKKQLRQLDDYRSTRTALLTALQTRLESLRTASATDRERELSAFAREQAAQIDALEQEAEAIREDLIKGSFFQSSVSFATWDSNRSWRLGDNLRYESRVDEFKVVRAAAYFHPYLIPAQRRLLQELALELDEPLINPSASASLDAPLPYLYFSPETSRARLPLDLPEAVIAKISAYQAEKSALKSELRNAIYRGDRSFFYFTRKEILLPLIEQQTPRIAALELLAEEIRRALAPLPNPYRPRHSEGSNDFAKRMIGLGEERTQLLRDLDLKADELRKKFPTALVQKERSSNSYTSGAAFIIKLVSSQRRDTRSEIKKIAAYQEELARFNAETVTKFEALETKRRALNTEVIQTMRGNPTPGVATSPATALKPISLDDPRLKKFIMEYREREIWELYGTYDTAMFEPGLSPGQRRLLFTAALQKLNLPIPSGSIQP